MNDLDLKKIIAILTEALEVDTYSRQGIATADQDTLVRANLLQRRYSQITYIRKVLASIKEGE